MSKKWQQGAVTMTYIQRGQYEDRQSEIYTSKRECKFPELKEKEVNL